MLNNKLVLQIPWRVTFLCQCFQIINVCLRSLSQQTPQILEMLDLFSIMPFCVKTGMFKSTPPDLGLALPPATTL